jgi:hypothetical protein
MDQQTTNNPDLNEGLPTEQPTSSIEHQLPNTGLQDKKNNSNSGDSSTPKKPGRTGKRAGRRKINIEFIKDKSRRHITFSKRKAGIMKKAYELSTLTGTQVLLLVASETGHVYTFATPKLQPLITKTEGKNLIQACLNAPDNTNESHGSEDYDSDEGKRESKKMKSEPKQQQQYSQQMHQSSHHSQQPLDVSSFQHHQHMQPMIGTTNGVQGVSYTGSQNNSFMGINALNRGYGNFQPQQSPTNLPFGSNNLHLNFPTSKMSPMGNSNQAQSLPISHVSMMSQNSQLGQMNPHEYSTPKQN